MGVASVLVTRVGDLHCSAVLLTSTEHEVKVMKLLEERQLLERKLQMMKLQEQHRLAKQAKGQQQGASPDSRTPTDKLQSGEPQTLKLALRKRYCRERCVSGCGMRV